MTTVVLVLKSAIDDHDLVVVGIVLSLQDVDHGILMDAGKAVWFAFRDEVRKLLLVRLINVHNGSEAWWWFVVWAVLLHHIARMLEHAVGSAELLAGTRGRFLDLTHW